MTNAVPVEFSRPLVMDEIGIDGADLEIEANADERNLLARRLDLVSLESLTAAVRVALMENGTVIHVTGTLRADVTQSCVVTLEPVTTHIEGVLESLFTTEGTPESGGETEISLSPDAEDPPEPILDRTIDLGDVVAERLALEINPFPRQFGASFEAYSSATAGADPEPPQDGGPFAVLAKIKGTAADPES